MRVIHIVHGKCNPNEHNGISRVVYYLNKHEKLQGIDSEIWAVVDDAKTHYQKVRDEYVTVECFPRVKNMFGKHEIIEALKKEKDNIDLVHFHMIWFYDKNIIAKGLKKIDIPYIITTHGTYSKPRAYTGKRKIVRKLYELDYLQGATELHILTREEGTGLQKYGYKGRSFVGYNGIEESDIPSRKNDKFFDEKLYKDKKKLGWVGVFREDKNLESLVEAVSMLSPKLREHFVIILVGPDYRGNAEKYLTLAEKLGCRENFDWIGPLYNQDKYDAYYGFDAYVMPSFSEGFSMAIIDAMACSKPMLLTKGCNMNYLNKPGKEFFVSCEPYAQDLAVGLTELIEKQAQWETMGKNGKEVLINECSWSTITKKMSEDYERIIREN